MNARSLHEIATGKTHKVHRTGAPVRRKSRMVGTCEHEVWRPFDRREFNARMRAAEMHDRDNKEAGKRNGPLGHVALEVYRELMRRVCWKTGRLDPAINTICGWVCRSRDAVVSALARLQAEGFLDWIRRVEPIENPEPDGPQVKQATNAYKLALPKAAADLVRRLLRRPTEAQRDAAVARDRQARADTAARENDEAERIAVIMAGNTALGRELRSLGGAVDRSTASPPGGLNPALQG